MVDNEPEEMRLIDRPYPKKPWWVATNSLGFAVALLSIWSVALFAWLFSFSGEIPWWRWAGLAIYVILVVLYLPAVVYWARHRPTKPR